MNSIARESLLYDFYGPLLTDRKRQVMEYYHEDDMSLSEIAEDMEISRAAVYDSLKSAEKQLEHYEEKLGLVKKYEDSENLSKKAEVIVSKLAEKTGGSAEAEELMKIIAELSGAGQE